MAWKLAYIIAVLPLAAGWQFSAAQCAIILLVAALPGYAGRRLFAVRASVLLGAFAAGLIHSQYQLHSALATQLPAGYDGATFLVEGRISGPVTRESLADGLLRQRFDLAVESIAWPGDNDSALPALRRLRLSLYQSQQMHSGERWRMQVRLRQARNYANPGGFDYRRYLLARRIDALGYIVKLYPTAQARLASAGEHRRSVQRDAVLRALDEVPSRHLLAALLLGDRSGFDAELRALLARTGTVHLFAISGLHISLAAGFGYLIARYLPAIVPGARLAFLNLWSPAQLRAATLGMLPALYYAWLSGMALSTQRALLMLGCFALALVLRTDCRRHARLLLAAWLILMLDPLAVLDFGFWYSVSAVALLLAIWRETDSVPAGHSTPAVVGSRVCRYGRELLRTQCYFLLAMPLAQLVLGQPYYLLSVLANAIAIPVTSLLVMPFALLGTLLAQWSPAIAALPLTLAGSALSMLFRLLESLAATPGAFNLPLGQGLQPPGLVLAMLSLLVVLGGRRAPGFWLALLALLVLLLSPARPEGAGLGPGEFAVTQLDVGQGTAILVETRRYRLLYDTGPGTPGGFDAGSGMIAPYLHQRGIDQLDDVVISHGDLDHAGGIDGLRNAIAVERWLAAPGLAAIARLPQLPCHAQRRWQRDSVLFEILSPSIAARHGHGNDHSCVLRVSSLDAPEQGLLLSGDIERGGEFALLDQSRSRLGSAVVTVPHHGSKTSSSFAWLAATDADIALLSAGHNNRYGHPAADVVDRYRQLGIALLDSASLGAVRLVFRGGAWQGPYCARFDRHRAWLQANGTRAVRQRCVGGLH